MLESESKLSPAQKRVWYAVSLEEMSLDETLSYHPMGRQENETRLGDRSDDLVCPNSPTVGTRKNDMVETREITPKAGRRLVAWIDSVGGYLICMGNEISLGQMSSQGTVDIPILADLSRRHAVIHRVGESYVLTPIHSVRVDGKKVNGPIRLKDQSLVQLGHTVLLRFKRPHALSATGVLQLESHHRVEPAVDAIVLMSDNCILGPQPQSHIPCRHWPGDLVLVRHGTQIRAHTSLPLEVGGKPYLQKSSVVGKGRLEHDKIGMSIEELS